MKGAQNIRGLWRLYPATRAIRDRLLVQGFVLRNVLIKPCPDNPFSYKDSVTGVEKPVTKLWIDNIPISCADEEIEHSLKKLGIELRGDIRRDYARYPPPNNGWSRFLTGRRFVFITVPPTPLNKKFQVGIFHGTLFHEEMKLIKKSVVCSKCLATDHHVSACKNEVRCKICMNFGHRSNLCP